MLQQMDKGCRWYNSCLTCPYTVCLLEAHSELDKERKRKALELHNSGFSVDEISKLVGISPRKLKMYA